MKSQQALDRMREIIRRKHLALSTEETYCGWVTRYAHFLRTAQPDLPSERKMEAFLTRLAKDGVSASTQNQAFNAILFFYREVMQQELKDIKALRAKRPSYVRHAPPQPDVIRLMAAVKDADGYPTRLITHLLYGCGLRVSEPLNLRIKDVVLSDSQLIIRGAKGGKDRIVHLPCSLIEPA